MARPSLFPNRYSPHRIEKMTAIDDIPAPRRRRELCEINKLPRSGRPGTTTFGRRADDMWTTCGRLWDDGRTTLGRRADDFGTTAAPPAGCFQKPDLAS